MKWWNAPTRKRTEKGKEGRKEEGIAIVPLSPFPSSLPSTPCTVPSYSLSLSPAAFSAPERRNKNSASAADASGGRGRGSEIEAVAAAAAANHKNRFYPGSPQKKTWREKFYKAPPAVHKH